MNNVPVVRIGSDVHEVLSFWERVAQLTSASSCFLIPSLLYCSLLVPEEKPMAACMVHCCLLGSKLEVEEAAYIVAQY